MKAGIIIAFALLWRLLVWIWRILIIGIIVGMLGNAAYTYFMTGKLDVTSPRTLPLLQWAGIHLLLLVLILLGVLTLTLCAWLAHRNQKKVAQENPRPQKEARYESRFEAPSQGVVIGEHNTVTIYGQAPPDQHPPQEPALPRWNVPYRRNPFFTGRKELLKHLHDNFMSRKAAALTQAISGLGGIGKTQTAVEYAYCYRDEYHEILWVNAATPDTLITSFLKLARLLNLSEKEEQDQNITVQAVKRWLEQHDHWLLIVDSADDLALAEEFLPIGGKGHILLTTRAQSPGSLANGIRVEKMDTEEGTLLLLRRAKKLAPDAPLTQATEIDRAMAEAIVVEMDGLPLAIDQAGAYIEECRCTLSDYLNLYRLYRKEFLQRRGQLPTGHPEPVATTWFLSLQKIKKANPAAATLLQWSAFLAPDAIPEEMIVNTRVALAIGFFFAPKVSNRFRLNEAMELLLRYSLLYRNSEDHTFSVHPLVQAVLRDQMRKDRRLKWAKRSVRAVSLAFPDVSDITLWEQCNRYLPHALVCARLIEEYSLAFAAASHLLNKTAYYLYSRAQYTQAEPLFQRALAISEQQLGPEHPTTATDLNNLALLYKTQGKYKQAEPLYQRALAIWEKQLGPEHPHRAMSLNNLAGLYKTQGKYEQAELLYQRTLAIMAQRLGPEHPDTAQSLNNLALLYYEQGEYEQAEPLYQRALAIWEKQLGPEHPDTAQSLNNLALLYNAQGQYEQAELLCQRALAIREKQLGPEHPHTATSLINLAGLYRAQGKYEQAEPLYRRAVAIMEQQLGSEHPDTATSLNNLALLYYDQGKYEQAKLLYQRALSISEQQLGSKHSGPATIRENYDALVEDMKRKGKEQH